MPLLELHGVEVAFGEARILRGVDLEVEAGETLGIVGESGCGKSMTALAIMGMVPPPGTVRGRILLDGRDLLSLKPRQWLDVRGQEAALVMQDPFTSLNPMMRAGDQIAEVLRLHQGKSARQAWDLSIEMLDKVGVPAPESSARKYPHQMSGGQRQRVVIAIAFACRPKLLIADEPTTALDVTLQAQILRLIRKLQEEEGTAVMLISHDIGVIASLSRRIAVYYAGRVVETGPASSVLRQPHHPYTEALLAALPDPRQSRLQAISGQPPDLTQPIVGCAFAPRCPKRFDRCDEDPVLFDAGASRTACWLVEEAAARRH
ncbi:MAG TPA: ABC transporter ATP-binding protein [Fimbriimonadaceae bacterium]|mgnify:CR=1 FL=1|nr:ABC transporter ATP-binding protein [Fimbriimonadaceae bacterium]